MAGTESQLKRFSQACENNKVPILNELSKAFHSVSKVLEIGSGTGQHAAFLASNLGHVKWQPTDVVENHPSIIQWCQDMGTDNVLSPRPFFIGIDPWKFEQVDGVFSANTAHIMQPHEVKLMMQIIGANLPPSGVFCQYGPFKIDGQYTSDSNKAFDSHLKSSGYGGQVDINQLQQWADRLTLIQRINMPANNMLLIWHVTQ